MSVAFRRESDDEHKEPEFELPIPVGPNLVTERGYALIAARVEELDAAIAAETDEEARKKLRREQRYWATRHATAEGRVLFTHNVGDFLALHAQFRQEGRPHGGLILAVQQRYSVGEQMRRILRINRERSSGDMRNRIEFLGSWSASGLESSFRR